MEARPSRLPEARRILELARTSKRAAAEALGGLSLDEQASLVCTAPLGLRARMLELAPEPERVIPLLPDAELCFTAKSVGLEDASWILEHATPSQMVACLDLDAWRGLSPDRRVTGEWLAALAEAGPAALLRAAQALDSELLVLELRDRLAVELKPPMSEDSDDWQPPEGGQTLDGQFYFVPRQPADDISTLVTMLRVLFQDDYWLYFRILQGAIWELDPELVEWALRWRSGRLEDLGFPPWDESMRIYGYLRPAHRAELSEEPSALEHSQWHFPVPTAELPTSRKSAHSVFRAAAQLEEKERQAFFYSFVSLANKVAVADNMDLGDAETTPAAIEKAAVVVSHGLDHVAGEPGVSPLDVLRRATLERLFRVGASLQPEWVTPLQHEPDHESIDEDEIS